MSVRKRTVIAVLALAIGSGLALGPTASATASHGYLDGAGSTLTDDWGDEGTLSTTSYAHSNLAAAWQGILYADGYLSASGIDCRFGTATKNATIKWQRARGLVADGKVGPKTFGKADNKLYANGGNVWYDGTKRDVVLRRKNGNYYVYDGAWHLASYTKATLPRCR
ncbi:peptidoglycan-binding domain-containing protein [Streptomyces sp. NPDC005917]|jgi:peptidoglycan hydrolase-like protein with peptidoglycan-binding domain|uniref:peptidoglycan-binding domain-containing protein n=1 Tax=unclassified Streptomyces TaxID=2593676 RepID=UPI0033D2F147